MKKLIGFTAISCLTPLLVTATCQAKADTTVKFATIRAENPKKHKNELILPYAFPSDSMGFMLGVGGYMKGAGQDQLLVGGTAYASFDSTFGAAGGVWDYMLLPKSDRLYLSAIGSIGTYPRQRAYAKPVIFPDEIRPGSNNSGELDYTETKGTDNWFDLKLEYVLPMGGSGYYGMTDYKLKDGLLESGSTGGGSWNPLNTGVTVLMFKQYNRYRNYETKNYGDVDLTIHPVKLGIFHDHTDFPGNPSTGSSQYLAVTSDFGWLESDKEWTFVEFEMSKYFSLGSSNWARQRIIALNLWTGDSPTWKEEVNEHGNITLVENPPFYEGATLGGFYRMRGYPTDRFHDRSVLYTTAEYRYTLDWNPIANISWLNFLKLDWLQMVGFVEGGRVANEYDLGELFSDWKVDGGVGLRALAAGSVVRFDVGVSEEGTNAWVMVGHPF